MLDLVVVGAALVLENIGIEGGGLAITILSWRWLRVVHGIASWAHIGEHIHHKRCNK